MATYLLQPLGDAGWEAECGTLPLAVGESQILGRQQHLLIKDRAVSRQHCQLHNKDGQLHLTANSLTHVTWAGTQLTTKLKPGTAGVEVSTAEAAVANVLLLAISFARQPGSASQGWAKSGWLSDARAACRGRPDPPAQAAQRRAQAWV